MNRVLLGFLMVILTNTDASYYERKLLNEILFNGYKKDVRPVLNDNKTITVKIGLTLSQIIDIDAKNQIMTTSVWTRQEWYNDYLTWNRSEYGNISSVNVKSSNVWLPDLVLYNKYVFVAFFPNHDHQDPFYEIHLPKLTIVYPVDRLNRPLPNADESIDFRGNLDRLSTRVQIFHDGKNKWLAPIMLRSKCKINVKYFPFDTQNCMLKFGSWTYDISRLDVQNESTSIDLTKYISSGEWSLEPTPVKRHVVKYTCCKERYPDVTFYIIVKRRTLFYLTNLILPLVIISALIIFVFTLPPQSGERISLTITLLLSMMVFMLLITENIPATSEVIPLVARFYMAVMLEMAMALVVTCYVIRCYHSRTTKVPSWMKRLVVKRLANFFGVKKSQALLKAEEEEEEFRTWKEKGEGFISRMLKNAPTKQTTDDIENGMNNCIMEMTEANQGNQPRFLYPKGRITDSVAERMLGCLEIISGSIKDKEQEEIVQEQWLVIATVMDRIAMLTFTIAIVVTMFAIFYQAPGYVS